MKTNDPPNQHNRSGPAISKGGAAETSDGARSRLSDEDLALLFAYLDDELDELEQLRFELRLSEEEDLAEELEALAPADALQRALNPSARQVSKGPWGSGFSRGSSRLRRWPVLWFAAVLLAALGFGLTRGPAGGPSPELELIAAALPFERQMMDEAVRELGQGVVLSTLRGGGVGRHDGPGANGSQGSGPESSSGGAAEGGAAEGGPESGGSAPSAGDLVRKLAAAEEARALAARTAPQPEIEAAYYALTTEVSSSAKAVVIELLAGELPRLASAYEGAPVLFELKPGGTHWIPAPPLDAGATIEDVPEDAWRRPFLVPRDAGSLRVILAVRTDIGGELLAELQRLLREAEAVVDPRSDAVADDLKDWLTAHGFRTQEFIVREPS